MNSTPSNDTQLKQAVVHTCRELARRGLTHGSSGNVSARRDTATFFISPTGMTYDSLSPEDIATMDLSGRWMGHRRPSSEWRFHRDIFQARADVGAIVHTHSRFATALACNGRGIPAFHYMVAVAGGSDIRCAPYATYGSQALSDHAVAALQDRKACLLSNHGVIATGVDLASALRLAGEVENLAAQYCAALQVGNPRILDAAQMDEVLARFRTYGRQDVNDDHDLIFGGPAPT